MKRIALSLTIIAVLSFIVTTSVSAFDDVTPTEAYNMVLNDTHTYILDVRTLEEWQWVGHPGKNRLEEGAELDGKVVNIAVKITNKNEFIENPSFLNEVNEIFSEVKDEVTFITMCRSGKRSQRAAELLELEGYTAFNMVTGFEGGKDERGYRTVNGWREDGLPYSYTGVGYQD